MLVLSLVNKFKYFFCLIFTSDEKCIKDVLREFDLLKKKIVVTLKLMICVHFN